MENYFPRRNYVFNYVILLLPSKPSFDQIPARPVPNFFQQAMPI
jgi:hypothetical protein